MQIALNSAATCTVSKLVCVRHPATKYTLKEKKKMTVECNSVE